MSKQRVKWNLLQPDLFNSWDESRLMAVCIALGAEAVEGFSDEERRLTQSLPDADLATVESMREAISRREDPLGDLFCSLRSPSVRRSLGATYTPALIVREMIRAAKRVAEPERIIDPGCGSARFLVEAGTAFPRSQLIGFEVDPLAALMARGHLNTAGFAARSRVVLQDYRKAEIPETAGRTLFVGNPPYIRHHLLSSEWKEWLGSSAERLGYRASQLAGLHVHFFLATVLKAKPRDFGSFITAAEWLDVNYGSLVRQLFLDKLGGKRITVIEPTALPFPDAATTAAVTSFVVGEKPKEIELARVESLTTLSEPEAIRSVKRERLAAEHRWSHLTRGAKSIPADFIELGELCRVHRGAVTGANRIWIAGEHSKGLPLDVLFPSVTKARELQAAGFELVDSTRLRCVIDLPEDLDVLDPEDRKAVDRFLKFAKGQDTHLGYIAQNRKAWWSVGLRKPAPILATYMARRSPSFVRNRVEARHINIAHGLYPRQELPETVLNRLVQVLSDSATVNEGRTYAGGLTKFEPREMERLLVPRPEVILDYVK